MMCFGMEIDDQKVTLMSPAESNKSFSLLTELSFLVQDLA